MNGIIHNCSHPNDNDVHFRITEEQIFKDIFFYLETLFNMIKPQQLFFLAVDGVAVSFLFTINPVNSFSLLNLLLLASR